MVETFIHAGANIDARVDIKWLDSQKIQDENVAELFGDVDGIVIPESDFGDRGLMVRCAL